MIGLFGGFSLAAYDSDGRIYSLSCGLDDDRRRGEVVSSAEALLGSEAASCSAEALFPILESLPNQ